MNYEDFLKGKVKLAQSNGVQMAIGSINPKLKPHQAAMVQWLVEGGRRACFASFGLGKSVVQLETIRLTIEAAGGRGLIVCPLGVRQEFARDAMEILGWTTPPKFVRRIEEAGETGVYLTNYETIRDGKMDPAEFVAIALDEAACFAPGTLVDTPDGKKAIESIAVGDMVTNAAGNDKIRAIHRVEIKRAVRLSSKGKTIISSDNHRYFTTRGWKRADDLRAGDRLVEATEAVRVVRGDCHSKSLTRGQKEVLQLHLLSEMADEQAGSAGAERGERTAADGRPSNERADRCQVANPDPAAPVRVLRSGVHATIRGVEGQSLLRECMLGEVANGTTSPEGDDGQTLPHAGSQSEAGQSDCCGMGLEHAGSAGAEEALCASQHSEDAGNQSEAIGCVKGKDVPSQGREWGDNAAATADGGSAQSADGARDSNGTREGSLSESAELLQGGLGLPKPDGCHRSGRLFTSDEEMAIPRQEEDGDFEFPRVDSVEILESGSAELDCYRDACGKLYFYDLSATRHPSYSVEGVLVHNCLRGLGGSKTFREFMLLCTGDGGPSGRSRSDGKTVKFRFVATATPSPNEYIELLAYADFLGVMDVSQAKTRFFKRDSTKADKLTLHAHKEEEFWLWVASWALFVQKPSDLGFDDAGYSLPELLVNWHCVASDYTNAGTEKNGQIKLLRDAAIGVQDASAEKRASMTSRVSKLSELVLQHAGDKKQWQSVVWCDLNDEQDVIEDALRNAGCTYSSIRGSDDLDDRDVTLRKWLDRGTNVFLSKPDMYGAGVNLQQCHHMVFAGIGFKFASFIQAIHRIHRFLQTERCVIDIIYSEAEYSIRKTLEHKWQQHNIMVKKMTDIIQKFGLSQAAMAQHLTRKMGIEDVLAMDGERWKLINDDTVKQSALLAENSLDLIVTSIPFSTQYEYSPNYADFGHSEGNAEFFGQMDFLTPSLLKALKPGRLACIHVKDRIVPGGMTGLGFQTVYPFHAKTMDHFIKHGFAYMGMKTIVTDVVRENNQTYRLGWTEQCKDGSKMGVGMPEYLLLFRKPPTDTANSYADAPVVKYTGRECICPACETVYSAKQTELLTDGLCNCGTLVVPTCDYPSTRERVYSRARWQMDAHGFARSAGDRLLKGEELAALTHSDIFQMYKAHSLGDVYNFEHHVKIGEMIDKLGKLPVTFMLLQPQSWSDEVWTDVTRMLTLNGSQWSYGKEMHLCPMQFDIADRCIEQFSMPGEVVYDPFAGLGTVPMRAVKKGRRGLGVELNTAYFLDACSYMKMAEDEVLTPTLFSLEQLEGEKSKDSELPMP